MPLPSILLGVVLSTLYGGLFHFVRGGSFGKLLVDLALAWAGFWAGIWFGGYMGWTVWPVGVLNVGMGTAGSVVLLVLADLATRIRLRSPDQTE
jgi:hypothetical protein